MSIIPFLLDEIDSLRPSRILDQHFGVGLTPEDLFAPISYPQNRLYLRTPSYYRPWRTTASKTDTGSTVAVDKDKFQINLDVQQFAPEEITVKVSGENCITVEAKHEEKQDEHGFISRHFVRRYVLPKGHDINKIESKLSSDGILSVTAPRTEENALEHRTILITQTGKPSKTNEEKQDSKMQE